MADAEVVSIETARARRRAAVILDADLAATLAELADMADPEESLPQARLNRDALLKLKNDLVPVMGGGARAVVTVEALYAMARELLDSRIELYTVRTSYAAYEAHRVSRADHDNDISCVAELAGVDEQRETLDCELTIETGAAP